jgi:hypothetical protein
MLIQSLSYIRICDFIKIFLSSKMSFTRLRLTGILFALIFAVKFLTKIVWLMCVFDEAYLGTTWRSLVM